MSRRRARCGFTLIELLAVLLVSALLLGAGVPSFHLIRHNGLMYRESSRLLGALQLARSESLRRNVPVSLCPSPPAGNDNPGCSGVYADGWMVFANPGRDRAFDAGDDEVIRLYPPLPANYTLTNRAGSQDISEVLTYLPDGSSRRALTLLICSPAHPAVPSRSVVLNRVGRPRLARGWGQCPAG